MVEAYLRMLATELRGDAFTKTAINADVQLLTGRSRGSIEYKFQNISAVLIDFRHPFVNGYKPASNYQDSLVEAVLDGLARHPEVEASALASMTAPVADDCLVPDLRLTPPPPAETLLPRSRSRSAVRHDYVLLEQSNIALGLAGELAVLDWERRNLRSHGRSDLAEQVEHVSQTQGDGLGYDISSFDANGIRRFIEVKTTRKGALWPMLISHNEVEFSKEYRAKFSLYRVFEYGSSRPGFFRLPGSIADSCRLGPAVYTALPIMQAETVEVTD